MSPSSPEFVKLRIPSLPAANQKASKPASASSSRKEVTAFLVGMMERARSKSKWCRYQSAHFPVSPKSVRGSGLARTAGIATRPQKEESRNHKCKKQARKPVAGLEARASTSDRSSSEAWNDRGGHRGGNPPPMCAGRKTLYGPAMPALKQGQFVNLERDNFQSKQFLPQTNPTRKLKRELLSRGMEPSSLTV